MDNELKKTSQVIFVSTGGFSNSTAADVALDFESNNITSVELSGGKYAPDLVERLEHLSKRLDFRVHNYFPPPIEPFVFNLASADSDIAGLSIEHVKNSLHLANKLHSSVYSFHAGYCIDPKVKELGKSITKKRLSDRGEAMDRFINRVLALASEANNYGAKLLVENNVLSAKNLHSFGEDPLLLTNPDEIQMFMNEMPKNVGLLLDVAHLKVSANSLDFCPIKAHQQLLPYICAYHLSDNDGTEDSNMPFDENAWFWSDLKTNLNYYSVEVYRISASKLREQQKVVSGILNKRKYHANIDLK